jgi:hypothetical protein
MMNMTDYEAYKMYLALKAHFQTEKYNVIEQRGHIRASYKNFVGSGKSFELKKLVGQYKDKEVCDFMVANFTEGDHWGGVFDVNAHREYKSWQRRIESLRYIFGQDLDKLQIMSEDEQCDLTSFTEGRHPLILRAYLGKHICLETLVILDSLLGLCAEYDQTMSKTFLWPDTSRMIRKYRPFLKFDIAVFKEIYDQRIHNNS